MERYHLLSLICIAQFLLTFAIDNERPIIGILSQELSPGMKKIYDDAESYIAASYVKYLEGAGARVAPIFIGEPPSYYKNLASQINGVLFPGGACKFNNPKGYAESGAILYDLAMEYNDHGDFFPLWGTCLGFELVTFLASGKYEIFCCCEAINIALPLVFTKDFKKSRLFKDAPEIVISALSTKNVTGNFHEYCVTFENFTRSGLEKDWRILSVNKDRKGLEFISTMESRKYPFYATMYHPEKNAYEWNSRRQNPHSHEAVMVMQYFANFFVKEARQNHHRFRTPKDEESALIYNYEPVYTGSKLLFDQCYFFKNQTSCNRRGK